MILAVDDEEPILFVYKRVLTDNGYTVVTANNGAVALEIFNKLHNDIDLILTDLRMPNLSGFDFIDEIRKSDMSISIIVATASAKTTCENQFRERNLHVEGFLVKPFDAEQLLSIIKSNIKIKQEN